MAGRRSAFFVSEFVQQANNSGSNKKTPGGCPPEEMEVVPVMRSSGKDVAVEASPKSPVALVRKLVGRARLGGVGGCRVEGRAASRCRLELRVDHVQADIHGRREVVLGARANVPGRPIVIAVGDVGERAHVGG